MLTLWVDKYTPKTLDEYVWRDQDMKVKFEEWIEDGALPHLLLCGRPGSGKTSLAKLLLRSLNIPDADILFVKSSSEGRRVDDFEAKIKGFVQTFCMMDNHTGIKYVILDESDTLSELTQKTLRSDMEAYSSTVRFILTCNYPQKIMEPLRSRCQEFDFQTLVMEDFVSRAISILESEQIEIDYDALLRYVEQSYPDMRKCIGLLQSNSVNGKLKISQHTNDQEGGYYEIIEMFKKRQINQARKILSLISTEEYPTLFRFMYTNLEIFSDIPDEQDDALLLIRDCIYRDAIVADREINLSATLCELSRIGRNEK